jgi:sodium/hydrogen antiporter
LYKIVAGVGMGYLLGKLMAFLVFQVPKKIKGFPKARDGFVALSITLIVYGVTEMIHGYGFMAVFVAGLTLGGYERHHHYHKEMHDFTDQMERLLMVIVLIPFGGSLVKGMFDELTWQGALVGLALLFIIRPLSSWVGLLGINISPKEKMAISFFGIRGIGSFYYLAFAMYKTTFTHEEEIWAVVSFIVVVSIFLHGITAFPVMRHLDLRRLKEERTKLAEELSLNEKAEKPTLGK